MLNMKLHSGLRIESFAIIKIRDVFHKARQIFQVLTNYKQVSRYIGQHIFYECQVFRAKILSIKLQRFYISSVKDLVKSTWIY